MSRCYCCNQIFEKSFDDVEDLCGTCLSIVRQAITDDNYIRPDHVLKDARQGLTAPKRAEYD